MNQERVILCHMDGWGMRAANPSAANAEGFDLSVVLGYLEKGFNIGFDCWGDPMAPFQNTESRDIIRYKMLCELIRSGYTSQIVLGHDMMNKTGGIQSGKYGYTRFPTFVPQKLKNDGFEDKVYNQMTVGNPARILAY
jgi:predicted metal-dependent phosphotriesterase family hydrolase